MKRKKKERKFLNSFFYILFYFTVSFFFYFSLVKGRLRSSLESKDGREKYAYVAHVITENTCACVTTSLRTFASSSISKDVFHSWLYCQHIYLANSFIVKFRRKRNKFEEKTIIVYFFLTIVYFDESRKSNKCVVCQG